MREALATVPGVREVDIEFASQLATIRHDAGADVAQMIAAIEGAGFKSWTVASEKKPPAPSGAK